MIDSTYQRSPNSNAMTVKSTALILLATLAAGTALGLMLAPGSGEQTRKKLMKKTSNLNDRMKEMLDEGCELIDKLKGDASGLAREAKGTAKDAARHMHDTASHMTKG